MPKKQNFTISYYTLCDNVDNFREAERTIKNKDTKVDETQHAVFVNNSDDNTRWQRASWTSPRDKQGRCNYAFIFSGSSAPQENNG